MTEWYDAGLPFSCTQCSACCRHEPGYVFMSQKDFDRLCEHTGLSGKEFRFRYTRMVDFGFTKRLSLTEKANYDCIFWDQGCTVYESRPLQCRAFPFWAGNLASRNDWDHAAEDCPGMNHGKVHAEKDIAAWLAAREDEPLLGD